MWHGLLLKVPGPLGWYGTLHCLFPVVQAITEHTLAGC